MIKSLLKLAMSNEQLVIEGMIMPKIEKGRPLPSHTKFDYYECYAKIVLVNTFPKQFGDLKVKDKPDLQSEDKSIGIEVTIAEERDSIEAERLYLQLSDTESSKRQRKIERIEQCGAKYEHGMLLTSGIDNFDLVNEAVKRKVEKLQSAGYASLKEYHPFVFSSIYADDSMLQDELAFLQNIQVEKYFKKIYVSGSGELYCFNFEKTTYERFAIDSNVQSQYAIQACQMVEEGEEDDQT